MSRKPSTLVGQRVRFVLWAILPALLAWDLSALVVAVLMWVLLGTTGSDRNIVAAVSTTSVLLLCVAWQNRDGPGEVCRVETLFRVCREVNPWPWVMFGLVFLSAGVAVIYPSGRVRRSS